MSKLHWYYNRKNVDRLTKSYYETAYRVYGPREDEDGTPSLNYTEYKGSTTSEEFARYICITMNRIQLGIPSVQLRK